MKISGAEVSDVSFLADIGSNIGPHSLTVAGMGREAVVLDAVYYNLALISTSHKMTNRGSVRILYNSISDQPGEQLFPYLEVSVDTSQVAITELSPRTSTSTWRGPPTWSPRRRWTAASTAGTR